MSASVAADAQTFLVAEGGYDASRITVQMMEPDGQAIAVIEYPGTGPVYSFGNDQPTVEEVGLQIQVRDDDPATGRDVIQRVVHLLNTMKGTVDGTNYKSARAVSHPVALRRDDQQRLIWFANFMMYREPPVV